MKICNRCFVELSEDQFSKNKARRDGLSEHCKGCHKKYNQQHYLENKDYYKKKAKIFRAQTIDKMRELKMAPCFDCKGVFKPWQMQFDHLDGSRKVANVAQLAQRVGWDRVVEEIAKCELVCANCHADRTYRRNIQSAGPHTTLSESEE